MSGRGLITGVLRASAIPLALAVGLLVSACGWSELSVTAGKQTVRAFVADVTAGRAQAACALLSTAPPENIAADIRDPAEALANQHVTLPPGSRQRAAAIARLGEISRTCPGAIRLIHTYLPSKALANLVRQLDAPTTHAFNWHGTVRIDTLEQQAWLVERHHGQAVITIANAFTGAIANS